MARLLLVDDEETIRFAISEFFSMHGYEVDTTADLAGAKLMLANHRYDAIIADLRLAGLGDLGGLDVIAAGRAQNADQAIILLTAYETPEVTVRARWLGASAILLKPISMPRLAEVLSQLCQYNSTSH